MDPEMEPLQFIFDPKENKIVRVYNSNSQQSEPSKSCDLKSEILKRVSAITLESMEREHRLQEIQLRHELDTNQDFSFLKSDHLFWTDMKRFTTSCKKRKRTVNESTKRRANSSSSSQPENESSVKNHPNKESGSNLSIKKEEVTNTVTDIAPVSKKRRGSPPKNEPKRNALPDLDEVPETSENSVSTPPVTKRRGRPPKTPKSMNSLPDLEASLEVPTISQLVGMSNGGDETSENTSRSDIFRPGPSGSSVSSPAATKQRGSLPEMPKVINALPDLEAILEVPTMSELFGTSSDDETSENTSRNNIFSPDPGESSVSTPAVTKRRGRPPKTPKSMDSLPDLEASLEVPTISQLDSISNGGNETSQIPETSDAFPQEIDKPVLPIRRGRPPSFKNASKSSPSPSITSQYQNGLDKPSDETVKVPKKRGPKKKCDMINTQVEESLNEIKRDPEVMEESRDDQKRVVNYQSLCNPDENGDDGTRGKAKVLESSFGSTCSPDVEVTRNSEAVSESNDYDYETCLRYFEQTFW